MVFRSILGVVLLALYFVPLGVLLYIGLRARLSKKFNAKYNIFASRGDCRQCLAMSLIPIVNLTVAYAVCFHILDNSFDDDTPLHGAD